MPASTVLYPCSVEQGEKRLIEGSTEPATTVARAEVDAGLHCPPIGGALAVRPGVGKTRDLPLILRHQERMRAADLGDPTLERDHGGCGVLKARGGVVGEGPVDRETAGGVQHGVGMADQHAVRLA